jgi:arylsulfatase A-like enzyme
VSAAPTSDPARPPSLHRALFFGLLGGAALGGVEMAVRLAGKDDSSVVRRSSELVGYAISWYAPLGALGAVLAAALLRLAGKPLPRGRGRWQSARGVATLFALALAGSVLFASLRDRPGLAPGSEHGAARADAPNLLVVVVDTLRADALGCYGAHAPTPVIDALAARGARFERVRASASWTLPSVASLFTSRLPVDHRCVDFGRSIDATLPTLASALAAAGYDCDAFLGNPLLPAQDGFARGFRLYDAYGHNLEGALLLTRAFSRVLRALELVNYRGRRPFPCWQAAFPFVTTRITAYTLDEDLNQRVFARSNLAAQSGRFLYVQYVAPHTPYLAHPLGFLKTPPPLDAAHLDLLRERYHGEVVYSDAMLGELLARLEREGFLRNAYVVVTSDHGEAFLEHGRFEHGYDLHREVVDVPLVIAGPGIAPGTRVAEPVELLDLAPTLLDLAGVAIPESFHGRNLRPLLAGRTAFARAPARAEISSRFLTPDRDDAAPPRGALLQTAIDDGRWRILRRRSAAGRLLDEQVYDLDRDPGEIAPLTPHPPGVEPLQKLLDAYDGLSRAGAESELSAEQLERMQGLGYVGAEAERPER